METSPPPEPYRVVALDDIDAIPIPGALRWRPVRATLGVRAFGVASFAAAAAGDELIEPHTETRDGRGHEELYVVVRGAARFELDGEAFDAPAGTLVFVQPDVPRHAFASEPGTEVAPARCTRKRSRPGTARPRERRSGATRASRTRPAPTACSDHAASGAPATGAPAEHPTASSSTA